MIEPSAAANPAPRRACVIGAGLGGLALAIRLQAAGFATVLIEARAVPGGTAGMVTRDGFTFETGPSAIIDPAAIADLWSLTGHDATRDVTLLPVSPLCRFGWPDGTQFDYLSDPAARLAEVTRLSPQDRQGFEDLLHWSAEAQAEGYVRLGQAPLATLAEQARSIPALAKLQAWRGLYPAISRFVSSEHLREALSVLAVPLGGNPFSAGAMLGLAHQLACDTGVWAVQGGIGQLVQAMAKRFEALGGTLKLGDPVVQIHTLGNRVSEVECASGWRERFDAAASNADLNHTYRHLLKDSARGQLVARLIKRRRWSPGVFSVHFAVEGTWPGIPHSNVLFGPRFKGLFDDIHEHGVLPRDALIWLHHPSVTDPALAPPGKSSFSAHVPVANLGKFPADWQALGPLLEQRVLAEVGRRLIHDLDDRIVAKFHYTPRDRALDLNAHLGSANSLEPVPWQSGWLRPHHRDPGLHNLFLVGAGTHPGAGVPGVLAGAKVAAGLMLKELNT